MSRLITFFIQRSFLVNLLSGIICIFGLFSLLALKKDLIPPLQFKMIKVQASLPGASPEEMEELVTFPLEETLRNIPGVDKITSISRANRSEITLHLMPGIKNIDDSVELARRDVEAKRFDLPKDVEKISVWQERVRSTFLSFLMFKHADEYATEDRIIARKFMEEVEAIPGVARLWTNLRERDIYVNFREKDLQYYSISVSQAQNALKAALDFSPVGQHDKGEAKIAVEITSPQLSPEAIKSLPISGIKGGSIVTLDQVADVDYRLEEERRINNIDGAPAILFSIRKSTDADAFEVEEKLNTIIERYNKSLTAPKRFEVFVDGPHFISQQIDVLKRNGLVGLTLVILFLFVFLTFKTSLMTTWSIPIAYFGTFIVLFFLGIDINLLSLIGLIIVIGILVDDAIIVSERYIQNLSEGQPPQTAAKNAALDLIKPVTGTIITTVAAFLPIFLIENEVSDVFFAVPVVILTSLALSWIESFFILPNHLSHFVPEIQKTSKREKLIQFLRTKYKKYLKLTIQYRYIVLTAITAFFSFSVYVGCTKVKHDFKLRVGLKSLSIYATLHKSDSFHHTLDKLKPIEDWVKTLPQSEIEHYRTRVGRVWKSGFLFEGARFGEIRLYINKNVSHPNEMLREVKKMVRLKLKEFETDEFEALTIDTFMDSDEAGKNETVTIEITGKEDADFFDLEKELQDEVKDTPGLVEVVHPPNRYSESWKFIPDYSSMILYKMSSTDLANQIRGHFAPYEVAETRLAGESIKIYTEVERDKDWHFEDLENIKVISQDGIDVPVKYLGNWQKGFSLNRIEHTNLNRTLKLDFKFDDRAHNIVTIKSKIRQKIQPIIEKYPQHTIEVVESSEEEKNNKEWAIDVSILCIIFILAILAIVLNSLTQPIVVGLPVPLGLIGIIWSLYVHDLPLGLMAIIGLIGTMGVAVNDSLIMVDYINRLDKKKKDQPVENIVDGACSRLRAVILTTVTTLGGVVPMAYGWGGESGFTQPLAFAMSWGLAFSTFLTLFILPSLLVVRIDLIRLSAKYCSVIWKKIKR